MIYFEKDYQRGRNLWLLDLYKISALAWRVCGQWERRLWKTKCQMCSVFVFVFFSDLFLLIIFHFQSAKMSVLLGNTSQHATVLLCILFVLSEMPLLYFFSWKLLLIFFKTAHAVGSFQSRHYYFPMMLFGVSTLRMFQCPSFLLNHKPWDTRIYAVFMFQSLAPNDAWKVVNL